MKSTYLPELPQDCPITEVRDHRDPKPPIPDPTVDWWGWFKATIRLIDLETMQRMAIEGKTEQEIQDHFEAREQMRMTEEETWLGVVQYCDQERRALEKENRAQGKLAKEMLRARSLVESYQAKNALGRN